MGLKVVPCLPLMYILLSGGNWQELPWTSYCERFGGHGQGRSCDDTNRDCWQAVRVQEQNFAQVSLNMTYVFDAINLDVTSDTNVSFLYPNMFKSFLIYHVKNYFAWRG